MPNSATFATGSNFDQIAQRDTNQTSGRCWIHNVGESISLFVSGTKATLKETLKLIAAKGKIQVQAQSGEIEVTGDQDIKITSINNQILVVAKEHILITAGGGYIKIANGNIEIHAPGTVSIKGANVAITGPVSMDASLNAPPKSEGIYNEAFRVLDEQSKQPLKYVKYRIESESGKIFEGVTDAEGKTIRTFTAKREKLKLFLLDE
jgi:type VI secretion system secreted protein VgrG